MGNHGWWQRLCAALLLLAALAACGPRVVAGDERTVTIETGPMGDVEAFAQDYCGKFGKRAVAEGGAPSGPTRPSASTPTTASRTDPPAG